MQQLEEMQQQEVTKPNLETIVQHKQLEAIGLTHKLERRLLIAEIITLDL